MALPTDASMAEDLEVPGGYTLRWSARSPTDGSAVAGVKVSAVNVTADDLAAAGAAVGPFLLVPGPNT